MTGTSSTDSPAVAALRGRAAEVDAEAAAESGAAPAPDSEPEVEPPTEGEYIASPETTLPAARQLWGGVSLYLHLSHGVTLEDETNDQAELHIARILSKPYLARFYPESAKRNGLWADEVGALMFFVLLFGRVRSQVAAKTRAAEPPPPAAVDDEPQGDGSSVFDRSDV